MQNGHSSNACWVHGGREQSRESLTILKISAVAAHHSPTPAFQTIILDRACPGSILKDSRPDTQMVARKRVFRVSRNAPFLPSKQTHAPSPSGANFNPPFFAYTGTV